MTYHTSRRFQRFHVVNPQGFLVWKVQFSPYASTFAAPPHWPHGLRLVAIQRAKNVVQQEQLVLWRSRSRLLLCLCAWHSFATSSCRERQRWVASWLAVERITCSINVHKICWRTVRRIHYSFNWTGYLKGLNMDCLQILQKVPQFCMTLEMCPFLNPGWTWKRKKQLCQNGKGKTWSRGFGDTWIGWLFATQRRLKGPLFSVGTDWNILEQYPPPQKGELLSQLQGQQRCVQKTQFHRWFKRIWSFAY